MPGPGYTFALAGFLKIMTMGGLAVAAPNEAMRTAIGQYSQYLMVPVGLGLCWLAKQVCLSGIGISCCCSSFGNDTTAVPSHDMS